MILIIACFTNQYHIFFSTYDNINYHYNFIAGFFSKYTIDPIINDIEITYFNGEPAEFTDLLQYYNISIRFLDLITTYRILRSRSNCINISKSFAYTETINIFDQAIDQWRNVEYSPQLFSYLFMNMKIMNIPYTREEIYIDSSGPKDEINEIILAEFANHIEKLDIYILNIKKYMDFMYNMDI